MNIGTRVYSYSECGSTNDVAKELAQAGAEEGTVVLAGSQSRGRGTKGRAWHSPAGQGLYMSVVLRPETRALTLIPLAAGLGIREGIFRVMGVRIGLKWPNDLLWKKRKLGGILCEAQSGESRVQFVVMGVGLNLTQEEPDFPEDLRSSAASLRMIGPWDGDRDSLLSSLWSGLDQWYGAFREGRTREILAAYGEAMSFPPGAVLTVHRGAEGSVSGRWIGLDDRGGLILDLPEGRIAFHSADPISVEEAS